MPSLNKMRIGVFGGAFAPPHLGHEKAVMAFLEKADLDLLYVIPSGIPPHKTISAGATDEDRLNMAHLAFSYLSDKIVVSDMELVFKGTCYSFLTLEKLFKKHPGSDLFLFVGTDQFLVFESWRNFESILKTVTLCVMDRYESGDEIKKKKDFLEKNFGAHILLLEEKPYIISSTQIRTELEKFGFSLSLSPAVNEYIAEKGIYASQTDPLRKKLLDRVKEAVSKKRFFHTLSVERETVRLAKLLSFSEEKTKEIALAALYHDLTKEWSLEKSASFLEEDISQLSKYEPVLHGKTAAKIAKEEGFLSEEGVNAIAFHTTGRPGMSQMEKVLYFADYIEEKRTAESCKKMRRYFYENLPAEKGEIGDFLDRCIIKVMENTNLYLEKKNIPVHPLGEQALEDLKNRKESV